MTIRVLLFVFLGLSPLFATLPPGVTSKQMEKGVTLYERRVAQTQTVPSFWDGFFSVFQIGKNSKATFPFGRSVALLVGIGHYKYINPPLPFVSNDVQKMLEYMLTEGGFDVVYVMDEQATPQLVDSYMTKNLVHVAKEDRLLFYFSGHGNELDGLPVLQFQDARPGDWDQAHVLRVDQFDLWGRVIPAKHVLFIYDACFAGLAGAISKGGNEEARASLAELSGNGSRTVVTAGSGDQRAWIEQVSSELQFSVFTEALIQALRAGAADDRNRGFFTIEQAVANAAPRMADMTRKLGPGHEMKPLAIPRDPRLKGSFVFLNPRVSKPSLPPGDIRSMGIPIAKGDSLDLDRQIDLAHWQSIVDLHDPKLYQDYLKHFPDGNFALVAKTLIEKYRSAAPSGLENADVADLTRLSEHGVREAKTQLGKTYESGYQGTAKDPEKAIQYYMQAAEEGDGGAATRLGHIYYWGREGIPVNLPEATRWYERGAALGNAESLNNLGTLYQLGRGGLPHDEQKAVQLYQQSADLGEPEAMTNLGFMYEQGRGGLPFDERKAVALYQKAADLGNAHGMKNLGEMYADGRGVLQRDDHRAVELYQRAADLGFAESINALGYMYQEGRGGLPHDGYKAVELYRKAIDLGNHWAMVNLAWMYEQGGGGLKQDDSKALELYQRAADLGNPGGMAGLGHMYEHGRGGLSVDLSRAVTLYQEAARLGSDYATTQLRRLGKIP